MNKSVISILLLLATIIATTSILTACKTIEAVEGKELPRIQSEKHLKKILKDYNRYLDYRVDYRSFNRNQDVMLMTNTMVDGVTLSASSNAFPEMAGNDFSDTNVQVEGVDEGDIIKTDGKYIYMINSPNLIDNSKMFISEVYPVENMKIVSEIDFDQDFIPTDIYLNNDQLIVIGYNIHNFYKEKTGLQKIEAIERFVKPMPSYIETTKVVIYDKSDISDVKIVKQFEIQGNYLTSRLTNNNLYIITNQNVFYGHRDINIPLYSIDNEEFKDIELKTIRYFPEIYTPEFMSVSTVNLKNNEIQIDTYLGAGDKVYASQENLYIVDTQYKEIKRNNKSIHDYVSEIHKFKLGEGKTEYIISNTVEGKVLNQFSMDEYKDHFRIATTTGNTWATDEHTSKNHVFILNKDLKEVGNIKDIAPTERIYSARFMGNKAYLVTFRDTDPLYVLDLSKPEKPEILGMLKIPGYSNYLHPYDDNHIIGFGKEVHETKEGRFLDGGMKIALFDVSDVNNPIEKFKVEIGSRGTNSELLNNHRALLFDKNRSLFAFPVTVYEENNNIREFVFQGAYIYNLDLETGFTLKEKLTHLSDLDYKKSGQYYYSSDKSINRILRIEDVIYTFSNEELRANSLNDFQELNKLNLK